MARHDIPYDFEDFGMTAAELEAKYSNAAYSEHPEYTREAYQHFYGILRQEPNQSYWDWVVEMVDDDAMPSTSEEAPDTVPVDDLDGFVRHLSGWHENKVAQLRHLLKVPAGTAVEIDGTDRVLVGELREGFIAGITVALSLIGELPFVAEVESNPSEQGNAG